MQGGVARRSRCKGIAPSLLLALHQNPLRHGHCRSWVWTLKRAEIHGKQIDRHRPLHRQPGPPLARLGAAGVARHRGLADVRSLERDPLARPLRHRRQYADDAGPRAARWAGLVRSAQLPAQSSAGLRHPLEPHRRSADRRADPAAAAVHRHALGRTHGHRDRADAAAGGHLRRPVGHRPPPRRPARLAARARLPAGRGRRDRHVPPAADRSPWLAARLPCRDGGGARRSEARARRGDGRAGQRGQPRHRAGTAALCRDGGRDRRPALGMGPRRRPPPRRLCRVARRRHRDRLCRVRLRSQPCRALRRTDAGMAFRDGARGRARLRHLAGPRRKPPARVSALPPRSARWWRCSSSSSGRNASAVPNRSRPSWRRCG